MMEIRLNIIDLEKYPMVYVNKYQKYLNEIPKDISECISNNKLIAYGYTSNLDVLLNWDNDVFSQTLKDLPTTIFLYGRKY